MPQGIPRISPAPYSPAVLPFPLIVGCTASGKSALALALARQAECAGLPPVEIVSADSMQVYRGMDIGTAKPSIAERAETPHHLIDIREPTDAFSVDQWLALAEEAIADIRARGRLPVVVGGSLLYAKALLEGLFEGPAADEATREALRAMDPGERRAELERVDPDAASRIHPNDERRTVRALEVFRATGRPISALQSQWDTGRPRADALLVTIEWETEALNRRINARVRAMVEEGLVHEVWALWSGARLGRQAREGLGYKQLAEAFERLGGALGGSGAAPPSDHPAIEETLERVKIETRRFGKNQRTWLRRLSAAAPPERQITLRGESAPDLDHAEAVLTRLRGLAAPSS